MHRICDYVCIHIGRVCVSNVYTIHVILLHFTTFYLLHLIKDNNRNLYSYHVLPVIYTFMLSQ